LGGVTGNATYNNSVCGEDGEFVLSTNQYPLADQDRGVYVVQQFCGDGYIQARLDNTDGAGWAGIVMRESNATGSKKVALKSKLNNFVMRDLRSTTGGNTVSKQYPRPGGWNWLRLERVGDQFTGYVSADGVNWQRVMATTVDMKNCLKVGLFVESINVNAVTTATFSGVETGDCPCLSSFNNGFAAASDNNQLLDLNNGNKIGTLTIYPNPSSGLVNIEVEDFIGKAASVVIYNSLGQEVYHKSFDAVDASVITADLTSAKISSGIYHLNFVSDGQNITKQVVIQK
jgi:hypothetical protein